MVPLALTVQTLVTGYRTVFPDIHFAIEQQFAAGSTVVSHWRCTGTHRAEVLGIAATGKVIDTEGISILHLENGKIPPPDNRLGCSRDAAAA